MQVSAGSLQLLLALPALAELNVAAFPDGSDQLPLEKQQSLWKGILQAGLEELQASFRSVGRSLMYSNNSTVI
jgi:hypothetical protein